MATSAITKYGQNKVNMMLMAVSTPKDWQKNTVFMRFAEENGSQALFVLTEQAISDFKACEPWNVYAIEFLGRFVKSSKEKTKYGFTAAHDVTLKNHCKISLAKKSFPNPISYKFADWDELSMKKKGEYLDIIGIVTKTPSVDASAVIPKMQVSLGQGCTVQIVDFLGEHASVTLKEGDKVVLGGVCVDIYQSKISLQTGYLTILEINPAERVGIPKTINMQHQKRQT